jgi:hypothetical protein
MPPEAWEKLLALEAEVEALRRQVVQLTGIVQELQERFGRTSRNSSQPSSADPPQAVGKWLRREPSGRRPGGQPGPRGRHRSWCRWKRWTGCFLSSRCSVAAVGSRCGGRSAAPDAGGSPDRAGRDRSISGSGWFVRVAGWGADGRMGSAGAGERGAGHGGVSPGEAHDPKGHGRPV